MGESTDRHPRNDHSESSAGSGGGANGDTDDVERTEGEDRNNDGGIDYGAIANGASADARERAQGRGPGENAPSGPDSVAPKYTRPPDLDEEDPEPPKRGGGRGKKKSGEKIPVTIKMCGAVFALLFGIASLVLVGNRALRLNPEEKKELGEALHETIEEFPKEHPVVKAISFVAPWARLGDSSIEIVGKRVDYIRHNRVQRAAAPATPRQFKPTQTVETVRSNGESVRQVIEQPDTPNLGNSFVEDMVPPDA